MPIRRELLHLYPLHWSALAAGVKAAGVCEQCGRPHMTDIRCLPDGRWWDPKAAIWRDGRGRLLNTWPSLVEMIQVRVTRVVLAACHADGNPRNGRGRNLRCWCQRCHLLHDRPQHLRQRWLTYRRRYAVGDLFLGPYDIRATFKSKFRRKLRKPVRLVGRRKLTGDPTRQLPGW